MYRTHRTTLHTIAAGLAAALLSLAAGAASAQTVACTKIGFRPGTPDPNHCTTTNALHRGNSADTADSTTPATDPVTAAANNISTGDHGSAATQSTSITGDTVRSTVAVFPAPSTAAVPTAQACIVTRSTAGGIGWNLLQAAHSEQYSDPVCVLQWLAQTSTDPRERDALRAEIFRRVVGVK